MAEHLMNATLVDLHTEFKKQEHTFTVLQENTDIFFVVVFSFLIFFMQAGFAFLECGAVRSKNATNILVKNMLDVCVSGIAYWSVGYSFAFGEGNVFIGHSYWFSAFLAERSYHEWIFQFVFAATASTIVSGAVAERCEFSAYLIYSFVITGFIYPVVTHWTWSPEGWLNIGIDGVRFQDFAGCGTLHLLGGVAALSGAIILGPRIGRFCDDNENKVVGISGHSVPLMALGGFILMFGFLAFNASPQLSISKDGDGYVVSRVVINTVISGSFGAFTCLIVGRLRGCTKCRVDSGANWSLLTTINGALTGMVSVCGGANVFEPWAACIVGILGSFCYLACHAIMIKAKVDDPLDAVAVHAAGGLWGLICTPLFKRTTGIVYTGSAEAFKGLGINLLGAIAIIVWTGGLCSIMFGLLKAFKQLRVTTEVEIKGLDIPKHGEPAYPYCAYGDGWGEAEMFQENSYVEETSTTHL